MRQLREWRRAIALSVALMATTLPGLDARAAEAIDPVGPGTVIERPAEGAVAPGLDGPVRLIDISGRVARALEANAGAPNPDPAVTDFTNNAPTVVGPDDIEAVADTLVDGAWLVIHTGWGRVPPAAAMGEDAPALNGWNHPGMNRAAVDRLIEVVAEAGIAIAGIVTDAPSVESGEAARGAPHDAPADWQAGWYAHRMLLPRGLTVVENAAGIDHVAELVPHGACRVAVEGAKGPRIFCE